MFLRYFALLMLLWGGPLAADDTPHEVYVVGRGKRMDGICRIVFSTDKKTLVGATNRETMVVWDVATRKPMHQFFGPDDRQAVVDISPDGRQMVSGRSTGMIRLWDTSTGKEVRIIKAHRGDVVAVAFAPDGKTIASAGTDTKVKIWEVETGKEVRTLSRTTDVASTLKFSPDGKKLAAGYQGNVLLWETSTGRRTRSLRPRVDTRIQDLAFSPDGTKLAAATGNLVGRPVLGRFRPGAALSASQVVVWNATTGRPHRNLDGHPSPVLAVAFSPSGKALASIGYGDPKLRLWDTKTGLRQAGADAQIRLPSYGWFFFAGDATTTVAFSPDGRFVAVPSPTFQGVDLWKFGGLRE